MKPFQTGTLILIAALSGIPSLSVAAGADLAAGQKVSQACMTCHSFEKGGPNRIGPNLWGVVGRPVASQKGFVYSAAFMKKGGTWSESSLDTYLENPMKVVPGTKMAFGGVKNPKDRANLIAWLKTLK